MGAARRRSIRRSPGGYGALRDEVRRLRAPAADARRLVSLREAARLLGVSRTRTLPALLREHRVAVVKVNGSSKVAMQEIERIGRHGTDVAATTMTSQPAVPRRVKPAAPLARDLV